MCALKIRTSVFQQFKQKMHDSYQDVSLCGPGPHNSAAKILFRNSPI